MKKPRSFISVDPGKWDLSWAHFVDGRLVACDMVFVKPSRTKVYTKRRDLITGLFRSTRLLSATLCLLEHQQIYTQGKAKKGRDTDPNDLLWLSATNGAVAYAATGFGMEVEHVLPREWNGSRPKDINNQRIQRRLDEDEAEVLASCGVSKGKEHNVIDAIGIGLWRLERL